jgi:di/tricarboxylate transporter
MIVALAASAAFVTPFPSPVNTMVAASANYRFGDFVRVSWPLALIVLIGSVLLVP